MFAVMLLLWGLTAQTNAQTQPSPEDSLPATFQALVRNVAAITLPLPAAPTESMRFTHRQTEWESKGDSLWLTIHFQQGMTVFIEGYGVGLDTFRGSWALICTLEADKARGEEQINAQLALASHCFTAVGWNQIPNYWEASTAFNRDIEGFTKAGKTAISFEIASQGKIIRPAGWVKPPPPPRQKRQRRRGD